VIENDTIFLVYCDQGVYDEATEFLIAWYDTKAKASARASKEKRMCHPTWDRPVFSVEELTMGDTR